MNPSVGVIAVVPDAWTDICMPRHQVVGRLPKYFPTVWIEPADNWREYFLPSGKQFMQGDRWTEPVPGMDVLTPGLRHPLFFRPTALFQATFRSRLAAARRRLLQRGVKQVVLYIWRDEFADAIDLVGHDFSCYHIDDEYSFSEVDLPNSPRELRLIQRVDQLIVHSPALWRKKGGINPQTAFIPNGVDYASFANPRLEPADLAAIPHPRMGYAGVIKKQLDLDLLIRLATARPQYSLAMVGPVMNVSGKEQLLDRLRALPNVHFLGAKPPDQLGAYMQHFDVCLMCYEVNEYTRYIYPLKMHEYLASGRPAISSPIDAVVPHADFVTLADSPERWLEAVDASLAPQAQSAERAAARRAHAHEHDWDVLVDRIAALFESGLARR